MKRSFTLLAILSVAHSLTLTAAEPAAVKAAVVRRADVRRWVTLPGVIRANQQAILCARVSGYLSAVNVDKGDSVKAGQALAEIEAPELQADLKRYEAEARSAETELSRADEARKKAPDLVLPLAIDKARAAADGARASIERTKAMLGFTRISAPFTGVVIMRYLDPGAFVPAATAGGQQNAALFVLADFDTVRAQVSIPEAETALLENGLPARFTAEALPGKTFECAVSRTSGAIDDQTRTMLAECDLPNPDHLLRPGMYITAKVGVELHKGTLAVPAEAVSMEKTNAFLYKIADGKVRKTAVKLGFNDGTLAEIAEGASEGEAFAAPVKGTLTDGQAVTITR